MQAKIKNVRALGKKCIGCREFNSDIMISMVAKNGEHTDFHDFFLTNEQAEQLVKELQLRLQRNEEQWW